MPTPFSVPFNISKGTAVADGYRIAPDFSTLASTGVGADNILISNSSYKNYGPGMLQSPIYAHNITPYGTTLGNIVSSTPVTQAKWLPLAADNAATTLVPAGNTGMFPPGAPNQFYLQFDWPRVPQITLTQDRLAGPVNVTFFGFDWYGMPLQHTYTIEAPGIYPGSLYNQEAIAGKAFYQITAVYFNGATGNGPLITCEASNTFGLPYVLSSHNNIIGFKWNSNDMFDQSGVAEIASGGAQINTPIVQAIIDSRDSNFGPENNYQGFGYAIAFSTINQADATAFYIGEVAPSTQEVMGNFQVFAEGLTDTTIFTWTIPGGGVYLIREADTGNENNISTATSGDVRGLIQLPGLQGTGSADTETWNLLPDGFRSLLFIYYCAGFDQALAIQNAGGQPQFNGAPGPNGNNIVPPNTASSMYGIRQYYTGKFL